MCFIRSEVKWSEVKWSEVKWSEVKWSEDLGWNCVLSLIYSYIAVCRFCAVRCVIVICWYLLFSNYSTSFFFYIHGSVHRNSILIRSNKMQQYAGVYLLQNYSTCFGCLSHPSSAVHQNVTAPSGTGHITWQRNKLPPAWSRPRWRKFVALTRDMTCTRSCSYSLIYSWWWVRWTPETYRVILQ